MIDKLLDILEHPPTGFCGVLLKDLQGNGRQSHVESMFEEKNKKTQPESGTPYLLLFFIVAQESSTWFPAPGTDETLKANLTAVGCWLPVLSSTNNFNYIDQSRSSMSSSPSSRSPSSCCCDYYTTVPADAPDHAVKCHAIPPNDIMSRMLSPLCVALVFYYYDIWHHQPSNVASKMESHAIRHQSIDRSIKLSIIVSF